MSSNRELTFFKLLAVSAALLYLYKLSKQHGGSLQGKYNPDKIAGLAAQLVPQEYRKQARHYGTMFLNRMVQ